MAATTIPEIRSSTASNSPSPTLYVQNLCDKLKKEGKRRRRNWTNKFRSKEGGGLADGCDYRSSSNGIPIVLDSWKGA